MDTAHDKIGTIKECGAIAGVSPEAMKKWFQRGGVPGKWHLPLLRVARENEIALSEDDLLSTTRRK